MRLTLLLESASIGRENHSRSSPRSGLITVEWGANIFTPCERFAQLQGIDPEALVTNLVREKNERFELISDTVFYEVRIESFKFLDRR